MKNPDIVVVGGGLTGSITAYLLSQQGQNVLLIENKPYLGGSATASLEQFRTIQGNTETSAAIRYGIEFYKKLEKKYKTKLVIPFPYYFIISSKQKLIEYKETLAKLKVAGFGGNSEILSAEEACKQFPFLKKSKVKGLLRYEEAGKYDLKTAIKLMLENNPRVEIRCETSLEKILHTPGVRNKKVTGVEISAKNNTQTFFTSKVVLATGAFSLHIEKWLGKKIFPQKIIDTLYPQRQQSFICTFPNTLELPKNFIGFFVSDTGGYARYTVKDEIISAHYGKAIHDTALNPVIKKPFVIPSSDFDFVETVYSDLAGVISAYEEKNRKANSILPPEKIMAGYYTETCDDKPIISNTSVEGLFINTGYAGMGVMMSPYGAAHLVKIINGELSPAGNAYRIDREYNLTSKAIKL